MADSSILTHKYEYRRRMPHYQLAGRAIFVTFCKANREPFPEAARDLILVHCLHDHGKKIHLEAAVVMPDHVHLLLTPLADEQGMPFSLSIVLKSIKGMSARGINRLVGTSGPVWQEESFDHVVLHALVYATRFCCRDPSHSIHHAILAGSGLIATSGHSTTVSGKRDGVRMVQGSLSFKTAVWVRSAAAQF